MIEVFAGAAVLCSVAKQFGLKNSIAVDKVRKRSARSTIYQLDLLQERDKRLLEQWMLSGLLLWVHLAPVCGTASRAPDIRRLKMTLSRCGRKTGRKDCRTFIQRIEKG